MKERLVLKFSDEPGEHQTFSQPCFSKSVVLPDLGADEQLYSCVYRDFGAWRAVAEYRNKQVWIKYAAMKTDDTREDAGQKADALVVEMLSYLTKAEIR